MLDRFKISARQKLQRAMAEVVDAELTRRQQSLDEHQRHLTDLHNEQIAALDRLAGRLTESDERLHRRLYDLEQIWRRDILNSQDITAASEHRGLRPRADAERLGVLAPARHAAIRAGSDQRSGSRAGVRGSDG